MAPEYVIHGTFSIKSDVYSFGVLTLEIITSKRNNEVYNSREHLNLIDHVSIYMYERLISNKFSYPSNTKLLVDMEPMERG